MNLKPWIKYFISTFFIISLSFFILSLLIDDNTIEIIAVTLITTFYQACIRPLAGSLIIMKYHNKMNFNLWWFKERKFERLLYKILKVKRWKTAIPTYDKTAFDIKEKNIEEILGATCQAEVVHEIMCVLAFVPLLLIIPYGQALVFILTSIICAFVDCVCIIVQRYNRPRLVKLYKRIVKRNNNLDI